MTLKNKLYDTEINMLDGEPDKMYSESFDLCLAEVKKELLPEIKKVFAVRGDRRTLAISILTEKIANKLNWAEVRLKQYTRQCWELYHEPYMKQYMKIVNLEDEVARLKLKIADLEPTSDVIQANDG